MTTQGPVAVLVHLSGARRGETQRLRQDRLRLGTSATADVAFPASEVAVAVEHGLLERTGSAFWIRALGDSALWVNGERVRSRQLESGDVLEIGERGPVVRFRLYRPGSRAYKSLGEAFGDCIDCARRGGRTPLERLAILLAGIPLELATQTSLLIRGLTFTLLLGLFGGLLMLTLRSQQLEERVARQTIDVDVIAALLESDAKTRLTPEDVQELRRDIDSEVDTRLADAVGRIEELEHRADATAEVIAAATNSVIFLQGAYGFEHPESGERLRFLLGSDGRPVVDEHSGPVLTLGGEGPPVERMYTGTGFVASPDGLLLTNRHVALPWEFDDTALAILDQGLRPKMSRLVGFLPGVREEFDVELVAASDEADVALLRCGGVTGTVHWLELSEEPPRPGEEVVVMGYPTGMQALIARSERELMASLMQEGELDFWNLARRLAERGGITPLATSGIVGQVTAAAVVYDAETAGGGSGGPVLGLDGRVVAINAAILTEFGGSNLGVPADAAGRLLEQNRKSATPESSQPGT